MFEEPFIKREFKGKFITFDVTLSSAVLGNIQYLNQLPAIMNHFRGEDIKTILDFGAGKNRRNAIQFASDRSFAVYISEFEQLISHNLSADQIKDPTRLANALRQPQTPLSQYLHDRLSKDTRNRLTKYDGSKPPTQVLQQAIVNDLNSLLLRDSLYEKDRFARVNLTQRVQYLIEQKPRGKKLLRLNRFLIQEAYPKEIAKCEDYLQKLLYPEELEHEPLEFDAILLSYVLHILPDEACRMEVLKTCWNKARPDGLLVVASPQYNTNARNACSKDDEYPGPWIGWVKYNSDAYRYKSYYSEPTKSELVKLIDGAGFEYEGDWGQRTAHVLRFHKRLT